MLARANAFGAQRNMDGMRGVITFLERACVCKFHSAYRSVALTNLKLQDSCLSKYVADYNTLLNYDHYYHNHHIGSTFHSTAIA